MTLSDWLKLNEWTRAKFAERAGLSASTVSRIISGKRRPDWRTLDRIRRLTNGDVSPNDFIKKHPPANTPAQERAA